MSTPLVYSYLNCFSNISTHCFYFWGHSEQVYLFFNWAAPFKCEDSCHDPFQNFFTGSIPLCSSSGFTFLLTLSRGGTHCPKCGLITAFFLIFFIGVKGKAGLVGDVGFPGNKGEDGKVGLSGDVGLPGSPGTMLHDNFSLKKLGLASSHAPF